ILSVLENVKTGKSNRLNIIKAIDLLTEDIRLDEGSRHRYRIAGKETIAKYYQEAVDNFKDARAILIAALPETRPVDLVELYVEYGRLTDEWGSNSPQAKLYRFDHPNLQAFGERENTFGWETINQDDVPIWAIDAEFWSEDQDYQAILDKFEDPVKQGEAIDALLKTHPGYNIGRRRREALRIGWLGQPYIINNYIEWHTDSSLKRPDDREASLPFYEDDWYLMEHPEFYQAMLKAEIFTTRRDFRLVPMKNGKPDRVVGKKYIEYLLIKFNQSERDQFRLDNPDLDEWGVSVGIWTLTMSEKRRRAGRTPGEKTAEEVEEALKEIREIEPVTPLR
ncbi:hypothetical protein LCGC14_2363830, partial [marine sediment metagenome]